MIELIMFIVIVSIALAGIVAVMRLTTANSGDPLRRKQALMVAEGLLEEVRSAGFTFCDPASPNFDTAQSAAQCDIPERWGRPALETTGTRPFDNVNDYVGQPGVPTAAFDRDGVLVDAANEPIGLAGYAARVTITPAALFGAGGAVNPANTADADVLLIRITVDFGGEAPVVLDGYRMRYERPVAP
jgi:MSHA pilin protein MshD